MVSPSKLNLAIYIDVFLYSIFVESILQNLVVFNEFVIKLGTPFHLGKIECSWVDGVHYLAVDCSGGTLFNLGQLKLK